MAFEAVGFDLLEHSELLGAQICSSCYLKAILNGKKERGGQERRGSVVGLRKKGETKIKKIMKKIMKLMKKRKTMLMKRIMIL